VLLRLLSRATRGNHLSDFYGRFVMVEALGSAEKGSSRDLHSSD
jgi:hypothetical protein